MAKERNSSIELFRILAAFSVMVAHFNGWFLDMPEKYIAGEESVMQAFVRSSACVCVNLFLIISGWFGVKPKFKSIWNLGQMLLFIYVPFQIISFYLDGLFSIKQLLVSFLPFSGHGGYYIQCYVLLLLFSPALNYFIENKPRKEVLIWSLSLLIVEFWYDIIRADAAAGFNEGYSVLHFIVVYMLGRSLYLYKDILLRYKKYVYILLYITCSVLLTVLYIFHIPRYWSYSNPIVIFSSFCLFAPFTLISFRSKIVNWFASSTLAVFIMHCEGFLLVYLKGLDRSLYSQYNYLEYCVIILGVQIIVFIVCVLYDKLRQIITTPITDRLFYLIQKLANRSFNYGK